MKSKDFEQLPDEIKKLYEKIDKEIREFKPNIILKSKKYKKKVKDK